MREREGGAGEMGGGYPTVAVHHCREGVNIRKAVGFVSRFSLAMTTLGLLAGGV